MKILVVIFWLGLCTSAFADQIVQVGGGLALLNKPDAPKASIILVPGGDGNLGLTADGKMLPNHEPTTLPRNRKTLASSGMATLLIDNKVSIGQAALYMKEVAQPVVVVGLSGGTTRYQEMVQAKPSGIILVSGVLPFAQKTADRKSLPITLVIHHKEDRCVDTLPTVVEPFRKWGGDKVRVEWIRGGQEMGNPCYAFSHHGLLGRDEQFRDLVVNFTKGLAPADPVSTKPVPNLLARVKAGEVSSRRFQPTRSGQGSRRRARSAAANPAEGALGEIGWFPPGQSDWFRA